MSEFHDDYPSYETMSNHSEEDGKKARKVLWKVFWVMLFITIFELIVGSMAPGKGWSGTMGLKVLFIGLTVVKAAAIVLWFMHLGHEVKFLKYVILMPYIVFILYTVFIVLVEGVYSGKPGNFTRVDKIFVDQQKQLHSAHHDAGAAHDAGAEHSEEHH
jgi:cytochrome c oxidase subunit IV